ncbi:hypothetical protein Tco_0491140 [Tanacetum coccineum]
MNYEPVTAGNQTNRNASIKDNVDEIPTQQYILLPLLYDSPQSSEDAVADDAGKKTNEEPANEAKLDNFLVQQKEGYANSTNRVSTVSPSVSAAGQSFDNADDLPTDPLMPDLEDTADLLNTGIFSGAYDDEDVGAEADLNYLETTMNVSPIPTTRIHKDHPKNQIIGDINLATQTRRMTKISKEHAMKDDGWNPFISQDKYVADILKKFDFVIIKTASTPIKTNKALLKDEEAEDVDVHLYRSMIRSLMYLTASRPDIMFAVYTCARFQVTPKVSHLHVVKRIFRYLKGEANYVNMQSRMSGRTCNIKEKCVKTQTPRQAKRGRDTKIPQFGGPSKKVGDEAVHKELGDKMERAATTASSLKAEQDSGNINMTQSMATLNEPSP